MSRWLFSSAQATLSLPNSRKTSGPGLGHRADKKLLEMKAIATLHLPAFPLPTSRRLKRRAAVAGSSRVA